MTSKLFNPFSLLSFAALSLASTVQAAEPVVCQNASTHQGMATTTPCPFLNSLIRSGQIGPEEATIEQLVEVGSRFGINERVMGIFAKARAEAGTHKVILAKLLDPSLFPAHLGSLARKDGDLAHVDLERLDQLVSNPEYSTDGTISFHQLREYQLYCWSLSKMSFFSDKLPARAEIKLLWDLFGSYRMKNKDGQDVLPVAIVHSFLKDNVLPEDFKLNTVDPSTVGSLILSQIYQLFSH